MHPLLQALNLRGSDLIQTPPEAIRPLLVYIPKDWVIWECASGDGNLVKEMRTQGYDAFGTDILTGTDFLVDRADPGAYDCIITNPPFSRKDAFLRRCYEIGKPFALLLPLTALGSQKRQKLFREHGIQIIMLGKRVHFDTGSGKKSCWFESAWFCWGLDLPNQIVFEEME